METEIVEVRLPVLPKGYRYTGEYRPLKKNDYFYNKGTFQWSANHVSSNNVHVVEKMEWVPVVGDKYYIISDLGLVEDRKALSPEYLKSCITSGNYFKTAVLAKEARDKMISLLKECAHD